MIITRKQVPFSTFLLWLSFVLLACFSSSNLNAHESEKSISIFLRDDAYDDYLSFLAGRDVHTISDFSKGNITRRDTVDMVLAIQALKLGGFQKTLHFHQGKITLRNTNILERGEQLISLDSYWWTDANKIKKDAYISQALLKPGEYVAGIFAHPSNTAVFNIKSMDDFKGLTAISTPRWHADWAVLQSLDLKEVLQNSEWLQQIRAVDKKWADFMLLPFMPSQNNHYRLRQLEIKAVPGVALQFSESRHFVISKKHPEGEAAYRALEKGLAILHQQGRVLKAYQQAGFIPLPGSVTILNSVHVPAGKSSN